MRRRNWGGLVGGGMVGRGHSLIHGEIIRVHAAAGLPVTGQILEVYSHLGTNQTSGGSAASANNDPVGEWQDQSGNGNHLVQATSGKRPLLKTNVLNGKSGILFDGSDDYLRATFTLNNPFSVFCVYRIVTWASVACVYSSGANNNNLNLLMLGSSPRVDAYTGGAGSAITSTGRAVGTYAIEAMCNNNGGTYRINAGTAVNLSNDSGSKGGITLGAYPSPSNYANIEVAAMIVYPTQLSTADETSVRDYLNTLYAIF